MADIFEPYDAFLGVLRNPEERARLDRLHPEEALRDPLFKNTREIGNRFQDGLSALFFATDSELTEATQRFGVF